MPCAVRAAKPTPYSRSPPAQKTPRPKPPPCSSFSATAPWPHISGHNPLNIEPCLAPPRRPCTPPAHAPPPPIHTLQPDAAETAHPATTPLASAPPPLHPPPPRQRAVACPGRPAWPCRDPSRTRTSRGRAWHAGSPIGAVCEPSLRGTALDAFGSTAGQADKPLI